MSLRPPHASRRSEGAGRDLAGRITTSPQPAQNQHSASPQPAHTVQSTSASSGVEPMSLTPNAPSVGLSRLGEPRRVRHQAREALALMAFSAAASTTVAAGLLLLAGLGR